MEVILLMKMKKTVALIAALSMSVSSIPTLAVSAVDSDATATTKTVSAAAATATKEVDYSGAKTVEYNLTTPYNTLSTTLNFSSAGGSIALTSNSRGIVVSLPNVAKNGGIPDLAPLLVDTYNRRGSVSYDIDEVKVTIKSGENTAVYTLSSDVASDAYNRDLENFCKDLSITELESVLSTGFYCPISEFSAPILTINSAYPGATNKTDLDVTKNFAIDKIDVAVKYSAKTLTGLSQRVINNYTSSVQETLRKNFDLDAAGMLRVSGAAANTSEYSFLCGETTDFTWKADVYNSYGTGEKDTKLFKGSTGNGATIDWVRESNKSATNEEEKQKQETALAWYKVEQLGDTIPTSTDITKDKWTGNKETTPLYKAMTANNNIEPTIDSSGKTIDTAAIKTAYNHLNDASGKSLDDANHGFNKEVTTTDAQALGFDSTADLLSALKAAGYITESGAVAGDVFTVEIQKGSGGTDVVGVNILRTSDINIDKLVEELGITDSDVVTATCSAVKADSVVTEIADADNKCTLDSTKFRKAIEGKGGTLRDVNVTFTWNNVDHEWTVDTPLYDDAGGLLCSAGSGVAPTTMTAIGVTLADGSGSETVVLEYKAPVKEQWTITGGTGAANVELLKDYGINYTARTGDATKKIVLNVFKDTVEAPAGGKFEFNKTATGDGKSYDTLEEYVLTKVATKRNIGKINGVSVKNKYDASDAVATYYEYSKSSPAVPYATIQQLVDNLNEVQTGVKAVEDRLKAIDNFTVSTSDFKSWYNEKVNGTNTDNPGVPQIFNGSALFPMTIAKATGTKEELYDVYPEQWKSMTDYDWRQSSYFLSEILDTIGDNRGCRVTLHVDPLSLKRDVGTDVARVSTYDAIKLIRESANLKAAFRVNMGSTNQFTQVLYFDQSASGFVLDWDALTGTKFSDTVLYGRSLDILASGAFGLDSVQITIPNQEQFTSAANGDKENFENLDDTDDIDEIKDDSIGAGESDEPTQTEITRPNEDEDDGTADDPFKDDDSDFDDVDLGNTDDVKPADTTPVTPVDTTPVTPVDTVPVTPVVTTTNTTPSTGNPVPIMAGGTSLVGLLAAALFGRKKSK